jgi:hypothetical protein
LPDLAPSSPVTDLWEERDGGLNGARARARLAAAEPPVTTVGELLAMTAEDIRAIPRAGNSVVAEIRLALTLAGLHLAGDRAPTGRDVDEARQAASTPAAKRPRRNREPEPPATPDEFAALVKDLRAELDAAPKDRRARLLARPPLETPAAFTGRPWAWHVTGPRGASEITGYSRATIRAYQARSDREHAAGEDDDRTMPRPRDGGWVIGDLALWTATRREGAARPLAVDDEQAAGIRAEIAEARRSHPGRRRLPPGIYAELAERYGVSQILIKKIGAGDLPAEGRLGPLGARDVRRAEIIPLVQALREREGRITAGMVMRELGTPDRRTAWALITAAGLKADAIRAEDEDAAAFLAGQLARTRRFIPQRDLLEAAKAAGLPLNASQVRRLLPQVRAAEARRIHKPAGAERARGESLRGDGLLYGAEVAGDWAVTPVAVSAARKRGDLIATGWDGNRPLYDPARLRGRTDKRRTPVDASRAAARPEPGDPGYGEGK